MSLTDDTTEFHGFLSDAGLVGAGETPEFTALTGGVSSDIWVARSKAGTFCVKRALEKLKVEDDWYAPIARNSFEVAWMQLARKIVPGCAPEILAHDPDRGMFAMTYLDPAECRLWKDELRQGRADPVFAARCGETLARIHRATLNDPEVAGRFATDQIFHAIRLEPYLEATALRNPDVAERLMELVTTTADNHLALVHGDASPKNILVTSTGPVFLDAECAWFGDPAFDLAFCLKHLLLKCLWTPSAAADFLTCFGSLSAAYMDAIGDDIRDSVETRTAHLLPGLFLGRIDGKSPVEYLNDETDKDRVRRTAKQLLVTPVDNLGAIGDLWARELDLET